MSDSDAPKTDKKSPKSAAPASQTPKPTTDFGDAAGGGAVTLLAAKYGMPIVRLGFSPLAGLGASLYFGVTANRKEDGSWGASPLQTSLQFLPTIPEGIVIGRAAWIGGTLASDAFWARTGASLATRIAVFGAAGGEVLAGATLSEILIPAIILTGFADMTQDALHEHGFNVERGWLGGKHNVQLNVSNAALALFPTDTSPLIANMLTHNPDAKMRLVEPNHWKVDITVPKGVDDPEDTPPLVLKGYDIDKRAFDYYYNEELRYFSSMGGHFLVKGKDGKPAHDEEMEGLAKIMHANPGQASHTLRTWLQDQTINKAFDLAKERGLKVGGTGLPISRSEDGSSADALPPELLREAAEYVKTYIGQSYHYARAGFFRQAIKGLDPKFDDPRHLDAAVDSSYQLIKQFHAKNPGKTFDWGNPEMKEWLRIGVTQFIKDNPHYKGNVIIPHMKLSPVEMMLQTNMQAMDYMAQVQAQLAKAKPHTVIKYDAETLKAEAFNIAGVALTNQLFDSETGYFQHDNLKSLQKYMARTGLLADAHATGTINGQTLRAIDKILKGNLKPEDVTPEQHDAFLGNANQLAKELETNPADPSSPDPRVLAFQTNAYLLGTYNGRLDGLDGKLTVDARHAVKDMPELQAAAPGPKIGTEPASQPDSTAVATATTAITPTTVPAGP